MLGQRKMSNRIWSLAIISVCCLASCGSNEFDMGIVQYYMVTPGLGSMAGLKEQRKFQAEHPPYAVIWSMLGTDKEDGPKLTPVTVVLAGRKYRISNLKTLNKNHEFYYMFEVRDQNPIRGLPTDMMTGNLTATPPEKRNHLPVKIVFTRKEDKTTWIGVGKIEQSTIPHMDAVEEKIRMP